MKKLIGLSGIVATMLAVASVQAVPISGTISMAGVLGINSQGTEVTSFPLAFVQADSGTFQSYISAPELVDTANITPVNPWVFSPPPGEPYSDLWSVGGFTFDFTSDSISESKGIMEIAGLGTISGNGYTTTSFDWDLYLAIPPAQGGDVDFTFAVATGSTTAGDPPGTPVPDGGMTVAFLGLALAGIEGLRRKLAC